MKICNMTGEKLNMVSLDDYNTIEHIDQFLPSGSIDLDDILQIQIDNASIIVYDNIDTSLLKEERDGIMYIVTEKIFNILSGVRSDLCYAHGEVIDADTGKFIGYTNLISTRSFT